MYDRIRDYYYEVDAMIKSKDDIDELMVLDCICHFFECEIYKNYQYILDFCKDRGFTRIFDIGCAIGLQSEVFLNSGVDYVGIDNHRNKLNFWNEDIFQYIVGHYPFKIDTREGDLGVSILCLTWDCYLHEKEKTLREQCEALQRDFKDCLLYMPENKVEFVGNYFKTVEPLDSKFVYFSNR